MNLLSSKNKLLVIGGPTGTGKTDLGIYLSKKFDGEIISADSRQTYKRMNIGTGKKYSKGIKIWGYDIRDFNENISVFDFYNYSKEKIEETWSRSHLPILVGGTGYYIRSILNPPYALNIPENPTLRNKLEKMSKGELFERLLLINPVKAKSLNESDKNNSRRLIRAIETANSSQINNTIYDTYDYLFIILFSDMEWLEKSILSSIEKRLQEGFQSEVESLIEMGFDRGLQSANATGYREMYDYINKKISITEMKETWYLRERQYVKRQITWFKSEKNAIWFDVKGNYKSEVEELVRKWNNKA